MSLTVKQLKEMIKDLPDNTQIEVFDRGFDDDDRGTLEEAKFAYAQLVYKNYKGDILSNDFLAIYRSGQFESVKWFFDNGDVVKLEEF